MIIMLEIVKYPNKILRKKADKTRDLASEKIQKLIDEMMETVKSADGIGLAANQVNEDKRIVIVNLKDGQSVFINPFIYLKSFKKNLAEEGCLSLPAVFGTVRRPEKIRLFYRDRFGKLRHLKASGMLARVLQHEIDHLNGVLFIDKIVEYTQGAQKVKEWQKQSQPDEL